MCDLQALENARLTPGARVLIQAGSGGVGVFAVQLAKHLFDAFVVSTTGPSNVDFVKVGTWTCNSRLPHK